MHDFKPKFNVRVLKIPKSEWELGIEFVHKWSLNYEYKETYLVISLIKRVILIGIMCWKEKAMTYEDIYEEFLAKLPKVEVEDYRPADPMFIPQLMRGIPNGIVVYLKDKSKVIYISDKE